MAQFTHRIKLDKAEYPLLTQELGRTVLVSNNRSTPTGEEPNKPEILYMHNVMPTKRGLQSIGYKDFSDAPSGAEATTNIRHAVKVLYSHDNGGSWITSQSWMLFHAPIVSDFYYLQRIGDNTAPVREGAGTVSKLNHPYVANVNGESYILIHSSVLVSINHGILGVSTPTFVVQAFIGAPINSAGITDAFGYMIMWDEKDSVAWSSLINPLDFTPSAVTGAGFGKVEGLVGSVVFCLPNSTGFLVYCTGNVVAAIYTGNKQYPFKFVPIENSKGVESVDFGVNHQHVQVYSSTPYLVASVPDNYGQFSYTSGAGLQIINSKKAETILPEITDYLSQSVLEDYDETTNTFSLTETPANFKVLLKKLTYIGSRYLVISYGVPTASGLQGLLTHAIVYDLVLEKMGKIKHEHVAVFEHNRSVHDTSASTSIARSVPKEQIALVDNTGKIVIVSFDTKATDQTGVLILGKYQYHRDRHLILHNVVCENVEAAATFDLLDNVSLDGRNTSSSVAGTEIINTGFRSFAFRLSGKNHSLAFVGEFILNTIELLFSIGGRR